MNGFKIALCCGLLGVSNAAADDLVLSPSPAVVQRTVFYGEPTVVSQAAPVYAAPAPTTTYYAPAPTPVTSYYAPAPVYASAPAQVTTYYAPAPAPMPVTTYYAPAVTARPVITYYAPAAVPVTTYYAPAPMAVPVTSYYAPAAVPVAVPAYGVVRSKVYYPGMPVRNFFKSITP